MGSETTKTLILDVAERRFARLGLARTSLRHIITEAGVNLAAVNYHFGSRQGLIHAVFSRRVVPMNRERLRLLQGFEERAADRNVSVEQILEAFIRPVVRMSRDRRRGGADFIRLMGRTFSEPDQLLQDFFQELFGDVLQRFTGALRRALPDLSAADMFWRIHFMVDAGCCPPPVPKCDRRRTRIALWLWRHKR